jgi:hypothetical protein
VRKKLTVSDGEAGTFVEILDAILLAQVLHVDEVILGKRSLLNKLNPKRKRLCYHQQLTTWQTQPGTVTLNGSEGKGRKETYTRPTILQQPIAVEMVPFPCVVRQDRDEAQLRAIPLDRTLDIICAAELAVAATPLRIFAEHRITNGQFLRVFSLKLGAAQLVEGVCDGGSSIGR